MFYFLFFLCILNIILFFPIPLKLSMKYIDNNFSLFLYRKEIFSLNLELTPSNIALLNEKFLNIINKSYHTEKNLYSSFKHKLSNILNKEIVFSTLKSIFSSKYKPTIDLNIDLSYGLENASTTAILYGYASMFFPILYNGLNLIFNIKSFNYNLKPIFKKSKSNFYCKSIIYISLANITYIIILFIKSILKYKKENFSF